MFQSSNYTLLTVLILALSLSACGGGEEPEENTNPQPKQEGKTALARVHDHYLYPEDLEGIGVGMPASDSADQVRIYVEKWINDELLAHTAESQVPDQTKERINRLVHDYRSSLILDHYEEALINERLDSIITPQQISDYYSEHKEQYQAGISWVRCLYVKAPRTAPQVRELRRWFRSTDGMDFERIKMFCAENDTKHILDEDQWIKYSNLLADLPGSRLSPRYLTGNPPSIYYRTDETYAYALKVYEYRDKTDAAPLSQVSEEISRIIMHQRRTKLLRDIRKEIYQQGKEQKNFEIFNTPTTNQN